MSTGWLRPQLNSPLMSRRSGDLLKGFGAGAALIVVIWIGFSFAGSQPSDSTISSGTPTTSAGAHTSQAATRFSDLEQITFAELPPEAIDTINLVINGGPYPFSKDDGVFQNREEILPDQPQGYYREYTVITPGSDDRGARRIVAGEGGDIYYTSDHYSSFREVLF